MQERFEHVESAFLRLSDDIYRLWDADVPDHLSGAAAAALRANSDALVAIPPTEILQWALRGDLPPQSWSNDFGDPSLTVIDRPDFRVDVLYWDHNASPTHKHVSCGAFLAHYGDRLHQRFDFHAEETYDDYIRSGSLVGAPREAMARGEVYEIRPNLIHDIFWLRRPSVTVSIRCKGHPGERERPNEFWSPGLEVLDMSHHDDAIVSRKIGTLRLLSSASPTTFADEIRAALAEGAPILAYQAALLVAELGGPIATAAQFESIVRLRSDGLGTKLSSAFGHFLRKQQLGGIYTADRAAQILVALMWAGASGTEAAQVLQTYMPEITVARAAEIAIARVGEVDPAVAAILRSRAGELLPDLVGV